MKKLAWIALSIAAPIIVSLIVTAHSALAGPPLLCHAIEIGDAKSLPWGDGPWRNDKIDLKDADFVAQALTLLSPDAAVLTRMETIRRATIHAAEHPKAASDLMTAIRFRVSNADEPDAMALFDLGYLTAVYAQMNIVTDNNATGYSGGQRTKLAAPDVLSAYTLLKKSSALAGHDAAIEFALALVTLSPAHPAHKTHLQNAVAGAFEGSLIAINIVGRFGRQGQTLANLRTSFGMAADGERR